MSHPVPPQTYPCTLACELIDGGQSHIGRMRWISLSYCFVEVTGLRGRKDREISLRLPGGSSRADSVVSAIISGEPHTMPTPQGESSLGLDLALQQVDGNFFAILQSVRQAHTAEDCEKPDEDPETATGTWTRAVELADSTTATQSSTAAGDDPGTPETPTPSAKGVEKRRAERREVHIPVRLWGSGVEIEGTVRNISKHGAYVETPSPIPKDAEVHVELDLPVRAFHYEGIVVNQRTSEEGTPKGVGVRFVPIEEMLDSSPATGPLLRPKALALDLSDPAQLARVYLAEVRHGGLCLRTSDRYLENAQVRVDVQLPAPHGSLPIFAKVLPSLHPDRIMLELLEPAAVKERVRAVIEEHRAR